MVQTTHIEFKGSVSWCISGSTSGLENFLIRSGAGVSTETGEELGMWSWSWLREQFSSTETAIKRVVGTLGEDCMSSHLFLGILGLSLMLAAVRTVLWRALCLVACLLTVSCHLRFRGRGDRGEKRGREEKKKENKEGKWTKSKQAAGSVLILFQLKRKLSPVLRLFSYFSGGFNVYFLPSNLSFSFLFPK